MGEGKNTAEEAVREWLSERGYDYEVRTYVQGEPGADTVKKRYNLHSRRGGRCGSLYGAVCEIF